MLALPHTQPLPCNTTLIILIAVCHQLIYFLIRALVRHHLHFKQFTTEVYNSAVVSIFTELGTHYPVNCRIFSASWKDFPYLSEVIPLSSPSLPDLSNQLLIYFLFLGICVFCTFPRMESFMTSFFHWTCCFRCSPQCGVPHVWMSCCVDGARFFTHQSVNIWVVSSSWL